MKSTKMVVLLVLLALVGAGVAGAMHHEPSAEKGKALFNDAKLGTTGQSCGSCHPGGQGMAKAAAKENLAATVNTCIAKALKGKPLDEKSAEMQSLVLYIKGFAKQ